MSELTPQTTHYIVHATVVDPGPESSYGTMNICRGEKALERALKAALAETAGNRRAFVTARDKDSGILAVIPVLDYPVARETHVPAHAQDAVTRLFNDFDWTI